MKTDDLVSLLANRVDAVDSRTAVRRYVTAVAVGGAAAVGLTVAVLGLNPGLSRAAAAPMFWVREFFCLALGVLGLAAVTRLARPGVPLGRVPAIIPIPVIAMWVLAVIVLAGVPAPGRLPLLLGRSARFCPFLVAFVASPLFAALIFVLRGLAPTRLRLTGAAGGFAAGSLGALAYTLHCPELAAPFLAVWYLLGILIPTALGAWLGPQLLRW
jgi:hypothetical protein